MVLVNNSFLKVVILGNLCGGGLSGPPKARILGRLIWMARARISRENGLFLGNTRFLWWIKVEVYLYTPLFLEKYAFSVVDKGLGWPLGMAGARIFVEKNSVLEVWVPHKHENSRQI